MINDAKFPARLLAAVGAAVAIIATVLPWYSFGVVLPAAGVVHIFAVTTTLWGATTVAPILIVVGGALALFLLMAVDGPLSDAAVGLIGAAIVVYAVVRCFDLPSLGVPRTGQGAVRAVTELEGGPFIELSAGGMLVAGALMDLLVSTRGAAVMTHSSRGDRARPGRSTPPDLVQ